MVALVRDTPSASSARMAGATRPIMAFSSVEPVKAEGLGRGMRAERWAGLGVLSAPLLAAMPGHVSAVRPDLDHAGYLQGPDLDRLAADAGRGRQHSAELAAGVPDRGVDQHVVRHARHGRVVVAGRPQALR